MIKFPRRMGAVQILLSRIGLVRGLQIELVMSSVSLSGNRACQSKQMLLLLLMDVTMT